uniref:Uncharacterized protein n=1 Tax=Arundo donax TaxID=35708 RepID=A0A0A9CYY3_ARUDO
MTHHHQQHRMHHNLPMFITQ